MPPKTMRSLVALLFSGLSTFSYHVAAAAAPLKDDGQSLHNLLLGQLQLDYGCEESRQDMSACAPGCHSATSSLLALASLKENNWKFALISMAQYTKLTPSF